MFIVNDERFVSTPARSKVIFGILENDVAIHTLMKTGIKYTCTIIQNISFLLIESYHVKNQLCQLKSDQNLANS